MAWSGLVVIGVCVGGAYLAFLAFLLYRGKKARAMLSWPQTTGTVSRSLLDRHGAGMTSTAYEPRVTYRYEAYGVPHVGTRLAFDVKRYPDRKDAQAVIDRYPENSTVPVYFNPGKPEEAILDREYRSNWPLLIFLASCCLIAIISSIVLGKYYNPDG